jgi:hypothetical protein
MDVRLAGARAALAEARRTDDLERAGSVAAEDRPS